MLLRHVQPSFAGGEVSPSLAARIDSAAYHTWLKEAKNFFVHPQGGASNRPGTSYMGTAKYAQSACRLIPFVVGEEEAYVLEFGQGYIRVFTSAGQLQTEEGVPYEIASPYRANDLEAISYTQYDQTLFLAHPDYPVQRLVRMGKGQFILEEQPIKYGPFMLSNEREERQLRVYASQETIQTQGVAATLSFSPVVDNRYFVYGYFRDELFFAPHSYGLDVEGLVTAFNSKYATLGVQASNLGGIVEISSPVATGGDWNGSTLKLTYQDSFLHEPSIVLEQRLSGGVNAGQTLPTGEVSYILESNFDLFTPQQVGGKFSLSHALQSQYQTGSLTHNSLSNILQSSSDWRLQTSGTWSGRIAVEKSTDAGQTWQVIQYITRTDEGENIVDFGTLEDTGQIYQLRLRACDITGQAGYDFSSAAFTQEGIVKIESFLNARQVVVSLERACGSESWTFDWAEGSFSTKNGFPACVFVFQDRLGLAGTYGEPQTLWFSKTAAYENFGHARGKLQADDAISVNLSGKKLNAIRCVCTAGKLLVFTAGSEWSLSASGALTPYNIQVQQQSERGAGRAAVMMVGNRVLYVQARGSVLRDFYYDYASASYTGEDLTLCAKHLFHNNPIKELAYQQEPDNLVWCVLADGQVATLTYVAEQHVCAWTHHDTQGLFCSVCTLPNRGYDEVWFAVKRAGGILIEKLLPRLLSKAPQDQVFLDASVSKKDETAFREVSGLTHLEGQSVGVLADGNPVAGMVVKNGAITLSQPANNVHVGLLYQAQLQTLPPALEFSHASGTPKCRVVSVTVNLADSRGGILAVRDEEYNEEIIQRTNETFNAPILLKTQRYVLALPGSHQLGPSLIFKQNEPLPVTLLSFDYQMA